MLTVILTTGWIFWGAWAVVAFFGIIANASEDEGMSGWAIFLTIVGLGLTTLFTDAFIGIRVLWLALALVGYLVLGVAWSFKKWIGFVRGRKEELKEQYASYAKRGMLSPPNQTFDDYIKDKRPLAVENEAKLITWMATWPLSFAWWALTYPRHFFVWAYNKLSTVFNDISARIWDNA